MPKTILHAAARAAALPQSAERESTFRLRAEWSPIARSHHEFHLEEETGLAETLNPGVRREVAEYRWRHVAPLLPPEGTEPGDVWEPPIVPIVALVRQLHPSAKSRMHHHDLLSSIGRADEGDEEGAPPKSVPMPGAPIGARATLLEATDATLDVLLRAHVEFHLEGGRVFYTPAQFEGRLVVDRIARRVVAFSLAVPDRDSNVDMNVYELGTDGEEEGRADIGYVPRLGLWTDAPVPRRNEEALEAARLRLRRAFYPFASIEWLPLTDALARSRGTGKPLHVVQLFGTLDDESC
ncbi:MAG: hypothetical protein AAGB93_22335 [Planctomycetota bacterium]